METVREKTREESNAELERIGMQGLSEMELAQPERTMFSAGLMKTHATRRALDFRRAQDDQKLLNDRYAQDVARVGEAEAKQRMEARRSHRESESKSSFATPLWLQITGFHPEAEIGMNPNERAGKIAALIQSVERLLRYELKAQAKRLAQKDGQNAERGDGENGESRWARPTHLWDPVRAVCFEFGISPRKLSAYCRELTGMQISLLVDAIRAESLRTKMKEQLRGVVARIKKEKSEPKNEKPGVAEEAEEIFQELKASRKGVRFHRTTWAVEMGFTSYPRMFQSCILCYGQTPHQLEIELIEELLREIAGDAAHTCVLRQKEDSTDQEGAETTGDGPEPSPFQEKPAEAG